MIALIILFVISLIANAVAGYALVRLVKRLFQFDEIFQLLSDDIGTNIRYFDKLKSTPLVSDAQEVQVAHKNMMIMSQRLEEFVTRMEEQTGRTLFSRPGPQQDAKRPVVI